MNKVSISNKKTQSVAITILVIIFASFVLSVVTQTLIDPIGLYAGGVTGIAQIILHSLGLIINNDINSLKDFLGVLNLILLIPFNILALKISKKYALYTVISTVVQTITLSFGNFWVSLGIFRNPDGTYEVLSCVLVAAILVGGMNGIMMRRGATSGGIITLCQYINLKNGKSVGFINLIISSLIIVFGSLISFFDPSQGSFGSAMTTALYTAVFFILQSIVLDSIHTAYNKVRLEIITEKGDELVKKLIEYMPHGITIEKGIGGFTGREKAILNIVIQKSESNYYSKEILEFDPTAFITIVPVSRIFGKFNAQIIDK
ncbi:YitT family protein [bacterium]|nr:YitT family protein [bacterium]